MDRRGSVAPGPQHYPQLKVRLQGTGLRVVPCGAGEGRETASAKLSAFRSESSEPVFQQVHLLQSCTSCA